MSKKQKVALDSSKLAHIVANGSIAGPVREGQNIPVLVLNSTHMPEIAEAIKASQYEPDGDAASVWASTPGWVLLHLILLRPVPAEFYIAFDLSKDGILVDAIVEVGSVYIKAGEPGDTFKSTFTDLALLVDVSVDDFRNTWPSIYKKALMESLRRNGLRPMEARKAAEDVYSQLRQYTTFRVPVGRDAPANDVQRDDKIGEAES